MKRSFFRAAAFAAMMCLPVLGFAKERVIVLSQEVSDIVVELGRAGDVVGKQKFNDSPALKDVPEVGLHRNISVETLLERKPTLVLGSQQTQPQTLFERLNALGVKAENVLPKGDYDTYVKGIERIGELLGEKKKAAELKKKWIDSIGKYEPNGKVYLLSYDGTFVAGKGTASDELIKLAGGVNAAKFEGLKPMNREAIIEANPDVIIVAEHHKDAVGGLEKYSSRPEIKASNAFKNHKIEFWPVYDYFGFSMRTGEVVKKLRKLGED